MFVDTSPRYEVELNKILDFIGESNPVNALNFAKKLEAKINDLPHFPYKCRQSQKSNDDRYQRTDICGICYPLSCEHSKRENRDTRYFWRK